MKVRLICYLLQLLTDKTYGYGSDFQAKSHSNDGNDVYFYVYNYVMSNRALPKWMGKSAKLKLYTVILQGFPFRSTYLNLVCVSNISE